MKIEILTIFPELFKPFVGSSLIGKACEKDILSIAVTDIRDFAPPPHRSVDDSPYGGGAGMVMRPEPLSAAIESAKARLPTAQVILLSPAGKVFNQALAKDLSKLEELILICGRYEAIDERIVELYVDLELSIGDYILMGGEIPAMVVIESVTRLIGDVIGNAESLSHESFNPSSEGLLIEAPHYTRPPEFKGRKVPEILLSGDHAKIAKWRHEEAIRRTQSRRPELLKPFINGRQERK